MPEARRAGGGEAPLSAVDVGGAFVLKYYTTLTKDRDNLHKFYKDESTSSRGFEGASPDKITYATGTDEIREEIRSAEFMQATKTEINSLHCQESKQGGISVTVLGYFVYADYPKVHFVQNFFLDKQSEPRLGYFVLNDTLRYISGKPEDSDKQDQADFFLPPPPHPPPMLFAESAEATAENQADAPPQESLEEEEWKEEYEEEEEEEWKEEEEEEEATAEVVEAGVEEEDDYEVEESAPIAGDGAEDAVVESSEVLPEDMEDFEIPEEKPKMSWAAMAGKLGDGGGGQLNKSKLSGFALPPPGKGAGKTGQSPAKAKATPASPPKTAATAMPVLPPPTAAAKAKAKAAVAAEDAALEQKKTAASEVRLWVSRIPTDPTVENQEVLESLNKLVADAGMTGNVELDRKDLTKDWASAAVSSQEIADMLVQHSKDKTILVQGKILKVEEKSSYKSSNRRTYTASSNGGKGGGGGKDGESKSTEEGKGNRGSRRGKGAKGGSDTGGSEKQERSGEGSRPKGGGRKGGNNGGSWRAKSQN